MNRPDQAEINKEGTEVERYIARLEADIAIANNELNLIRKIVGAGENSDLGAAVQDLVSKLLSIRNVESQRLDQFAAAALTGWLASFAGTEHSPIPSGVSTLCYDHAESMLAESKNRQGRLL